MNGFSTQPDEAIDFSCGTLLDLPTPGVTVVTRSHMHKSVSPGPAIALRTFPYFSRLLFPSRKWDNTE